MKIFLWKNVSHKISKKDNRCCCSLFNLLNTTESSSSLSAFWFSAFFSLGLRWIAQALKYKCVCVWERVRERENIIQHYDSQRETPNLTCCCLSHLNSTLSLSLSLFLSLSLSLSLPLSVYLSLSLSLSLNPLAIARASNELIFSTAAFRASVRRQHFELKPVTPY